MRKTRLILLAVASVLLLTSALFWVGCSRDVNSPNTDIARFLPGDAAAIARVMAVQDRNTANLLKIDGVMGTGTTLDANGNPAIVVFTKDAAGVGKMATKIEDVPVVTEVTGEFTAFALTGTYRPVPIGVSVGNDNECASGTIGCQVVKGGVKYILSNNHVLARENAAAKGERIDQPGRYDTRCGASGQVATLTDFEPIRFGGQSNTIDAAIAQYVSGITNTCSTPSGYYGFPGTTIISPSVNLRIKKVGRTTSLTTATITSINVTVNVGYTGGTATFTGQFMTSSKFTKAGDSGSLVVTNDANNNPVGLLFAGTQAGNAVCNPIGPVLSRFGVTICNQ
jgi:hypothetical protein